MYGSRSSGEIPNIPFFESVGAARCPSGLCYDSAADACPPCTTVDVCAGVPDNAVGSDGVCEMAVCGRVWRGRGGGLPACRAGSSALTGQVVQGVCSYDEQPRCVYEGPSGDDVGTSGNDTVVGSGDGADSRTGGGDASTTEEVSA